MFHLFSNPEHKEHYSNNNDRYSPLFLLMTAGGMKGSSPKQPSKANHSEQAWCFTLRYNPRF
jgi:hypothetical protein